MTQHARDEARFDMVTYHKALIANRVEVAIGIEKKYGLFGHTPQVVSVGLQAASEGRDVADAIEDHLDESSE